MAFEERLAHAEEEGVCARRKSDERAAEVEALKAQVGRNFQVCHTGGVTAAPRWRVQGCADPSWTPRTACIDPA